MDFWNSMNQTILYSAFGVVAVNRCESLRIAESATASGAQLNAEICMSLSDLWLTTWLRH